MTEEEKKEFEEFLKWKKEKESKSLLDEKPSEVTVSKVEHKTDDIDKNTENEPEKADNKPVESDGGLVVPPIVWIMALVLVFFVFLGIFLGSKKEVQQPELSYDEIEAADSIEVIEDEILKKPELSKVVWDFTITKDEMTDTKNIWATIRSDNFISQDFPYEGYTYASITVRYMKKYGYDVIIQITKGQIDGREYYGTHYVTARFDDGSPKKYYFNKAADGSSEMVFLRNYSDFIKRCKQAKNIKIDIPIYKSGRPVFSFHVDEPLVWREE